MSIAAVSTPPSTTALALAREKHIAMGQYHTCKGNNIPPGLLLPVPMTRTWPMTESSNFTLCASIRSNAWCDICSKCYESRFQILRLHVLATVICFLCISYNKPFFISESKEMLWRKLTSKITHYPLSVGIPFVHHSTLMKQESVTDKSLNILHKNVRGGGNVLSTPGSARNIIIYYLKINNNF